MANVELATAYISLVPTMKGAQGAIARELGAVDADGIGKNIGGRMGGGLVGSMKSLVGPALAVLGAGMFGGFIKDAAAASDATDKFKATMSFAGLDTSAITAATQAAKGFADQTVYDLPTIQNTIAQLASNGVKDYTGLTKAAGNLNAVAGGNADTFKSVAMVMTQTAGAGKLTTENWNQMADAIPGAAGPLMKSLEEAGAYTGNFRDAMAAGEITSDEFNASLMKLGNDPVAVEAAKSTKTFEGAIGGLTATINSGLMSALDAMKPAITGVINGLSSGISAVSGAIGAIFTLMKTGDFNGGIGKALGIEEDSPVVGVILGIRDGVIGAFGSIRSALSGIDFAGIFGGLVAVVGPLIPQFLSLFTAVSPIQTIFQAIAPMLPQLLGVFGQLATVVGGTLSTALTTLVPVFIQLQAVFVSVFQQVLATALPVVVQLVTMLGQTFAQLMPIIVPIITTLAGLAVTLISQLMPVFMQLVSTVLPMVVTIFGAVLQAIGPLIGMIAGLLIPIIQALMPVVVTVFGVIASVIGSVMQIVMGVIQVVTGIISGNWAQVWSGIGSIFAGIWNTIVAVVGGAIQIVWSVISAGIGLVVGFIGSALGNIGRFFADTWNNVVNGVSSMIGNVVGFFGGLIGKITGAIGNAGRALWDTGVNIIQGLIDGIGSMMGAIGRAVISIVPEAIRGPFEQLLGIHSPSRVFKAYGGYIGQGLVIGLTGAAPKIRSTVQGMAKQVMAAFDHKAIGSGTKNNLLSSISRTNDQLVRLAGRRDGILKSLKAAEGKYAAAAKTRNEYAAGVAGEVLGGVDASKTFDLAGRLTAQIAKTKEFTSTLSQLKKAGLDSVTYKQLADGGLDSLGAARSLLATGASGIAKVGGLQKQLVTAANGLGNTAANNLYGAGVNAAKGLVDGLKSQQAAITEQMTGIAKAMSGALKKALGIRSPSRVFRGHGVNIGQGLILGIGDMRPDIESAVNGMVTVPTSPAYGSATAAGDYRTSGGFGSTFNIYETDDPIATAHAVTRRQTALAT